MSSSSISPVTTLSTFDSSYLVFQKQQENDFGMRIAIKKKGEKLIPLIIASPEVKNDVP